MSYNPSFKDHLFIKDTKLIYKENEEEQQLDISKFYLPEMLYNENFRKQISEEHELTSKDLFDIIKLYVETEEILLKEQMELSLYPTILSVEYRNKENQEFLVITDSQHKKYRYDTKEPEKIINLYTDLKNQKGNVTLKELGSVINNGK